MVHLKKWKLSLAVNISSHSHPSAFLEPAEASISGPQLLSRYQNRLRVSHVLAGCVTLFAAATRSGEFAKSRCRQGRPEHLSSNRRPLRCQRVRRGDLQGLEDADCSRPSQLDDVASDSWEIGNLNSGPNVDKRPQRRIAIPGVPISK